MAPTFPLAMPPIPYAGCEFTLARQVAGARLRSGAAQRIGVGVDYWQATWRTAPLNRDQYDDLMAFIETLSFGLHTFLGTDLGRPFPRAYSAGFAGINRAGGGAFDGTATVTAINATTISLSNLPANFVLNAGDWMGLVQDGKYSLHRFQEARTGAGAGNLTGIYLSPAPMPTVFTTSAVANFARPKALMLIEPEAVPAPRTFHPYSDPIVFSASQKVM